MKKKIILNSKTKDFIVYLKKLKFSTKIFNFSLYPTS